MKRIAPWRRADVNETRALRAWAVAALGNGACGAPPNSSVASCGFFLAVEGCAQPLRSAMARRGLDFDPGRAELLRQQASGEVRSALAAIAELRVIQRIATAAGCRVIVLKGARIALERTCLRMKDVDVLASAEEAQSLAAALLARGYRSPGPDDPCQPAQRYRSDSIPIEVHGFVRGLAPTERLIAGAIPCAALPGLFVLSQADHLTHLLYHVLIHHPERRGRLRDVLAISHALARTGEADLEAATRQLSGRVDGRAVRALVDFAREFTPGTWPEDDPFADVTARKYALLRVVGGMPSIEAAVQRAANALADSRPASVELRDAMRPPLSSPSLRPVLGRVWKIPVLGPCIRVTGRLVRTAAVIVATRVVTAVVARPWLEVR